MENKIINRIKRAKDIAAFHQTRESFFQKRLSEKFREASPFTIRSYYIYEYLITSSKDINLCLMQSLDDVSFLNSDEFDFYLDIMSDLKCSRAVWWIRDMFKTDFKKPNFALTIKTISQIRSLAKIDTVLYYFGNHSNDPFYEQGLNILANSKIANIDFTLDMIINKNLRPNSEKFNFLIKLMLQISNKAVATITYQAICNPKINNSIFYEEIIKSISLALNYKIAHNLYQIALYDDNMFSQIKHATDYEAIRKLAYLTSLYSFDKSYVIEYAQKIK